MLSVKEQSELSLLREENKNLKNENEKLLSRINELENELAKAHAETRQAKYDKNWSEIVNSPHNPFFQKPKRR